MALTKLEKALKECIPPPSQKVNGIKTLFFDFRVALTFMAVALAPPKFNHLSLAQISTKFILKLLKNTPFL